MVRGNANKYCQGGADGSGVGQWSLGPIDCACGASRPSDWGVPITVEVVEGGIFLRVSGKPKLSLAQKLKAFDPAKARRERPMAAGQTRRRGVLMAAAPLWVPDRRDIIWIDLNPQAGREMKDLHPMLVLSPKPFKRSHKHRHRPSHDDCCSSMTPTPLRSDSLGPKGCRELCSGAPTEVLLFGAPAQRRRILGSRCRRQCLRPLAKP